MSTLKFFWTDNKFFSEFKTLCFSEFDSVLASLKRYAGTHPNEVFWNSYNFLCHWIMSLICVFVLLTFLTHILNKKKLNNFKILWLLSNIQVVLDVLKLTKRSINYSKDFFIIIHVSNLTKFSENQISILCFCCCI